MEAVLKATGLTKRYHGSPALDGLNLELPAGKIIGLLGPNGSGKTTFIKMAAGLLTPTAGEITICGEKIGPKSKALVSYLPDRTCFSKQRKVTELLDFFGDFYEDFDRNRAEHMLSALGIDPQARFRTLSKGTQEKVQLVMIHSLTRLHLIIQQVISRVLWLSRARSTMLISSRRCQPTGKVDWISRLLAAVWD